MLVGIEDVAKLIDFGPIIRTLPGLPPRDELSQRRRQERYCHRKEQRGIHRVGMFRGEVEHCEHSWVEECLGGEGERLGGTIQHGAKG